MYTISPSRHIAANARRPLICTAVICCYAALVMESANTLLLCKEKDDKLYALSHRTPQPNTIIIICDPQSTHGGFKLNSTKHGFNNSLCFSIYINLVIAAATYK